MDPLEAVSSWIKRRFQTHKSTAEISPANGWSYEQLKHYLISLHRGHEAYANMDQFPDYITLSQDWHHVFNSVRVLTARDQHERYGSIGTDKIGNSLLLQQKPDFGTPNFVPSHIVSYSRLKARLDGGADNVTGDYHSHPHHHGIPGFSAGDFYCLINSYLAFMILIDKDENLVLFKTKQSKGLEIYPTKPDQDEFEKYWMHKHGYSLRGTIRTGRYRIQRQNYHDKPSHSRQINVDIAAEHNLALYVGKTNQPLKRIYPLKGVPIED